VGTKGALATTVGLTASWPTGGVHQRGQGPGPGGRENAVKPHADAGRSGGGGGAGAPLTVIFLAVGAGGLLLWLAKHGYLSKMAGAEAPVEACRIVLAPKVTAWHFRSAKWRKTNP